jgi:hypothetical protein
MLQAATPAASGKSAPMQVDSSRVPPCPRAPVTVAFDNGASIAWRGGRDGNACRRDLHLPSGEAISQRWYAPTFTTVSSSSDSFAGQVKPWVLWPLQAGRVLNGRFDGAGADPGTQGSWLYRMAVDGTERITTRAGTFDVIVVTRDEEALGGSFKSKLREWYAPALGVSVRTAYTDTNGISSVQEAISIRR